MSNVFTLDSFREEVEREFVAFQITLDDKTLTLRNILRLPKKDRDVVYGLLDEMAAVEGQGLSSTEASAEIVLKIIPLVADNKKLADILVTQIKDDLALTLKLFSAWMNVGQTGEADGSES